MLILREAADNPVKRRFHKFPDFPLSSDNDTENAGHDSADRDDAVIHREKVADSRTVAERHRSREVNSHQIVFLRAQIRGSAHIVICAVVFRFADAAQDFFLRKRIDPDAQLFLVSDTRLRGYKAVYIFSLASRVRADIDRIDLFICQQLSDGIKLFLCTGGIDHLITIFIRYEGNGIERPFLHLGIICVRVTHCDEVPEAPGHNGILSFLIPVSGCEFKI